MSDTIAAYRYRRYRVRDRHSPRLRPAGAGRGGRSVPAPPMVGCRARGRRLVYGCLLDARGRARPGPLPVHRKPRPHSYTARHRRAPVSRSPCAARRAGALFAAGARQAGSGEFTKRAFLDGRLDLTEAEAVMTSSRPDRRRPRHARRAAQAERLFGRG